MNKVFFYNSINHILNKIGLEVRRHPTRDMKRLLHYLKKNQVTTCLDVGANTGQYAMHLRAAGFKGKIWSFEPQSAAFAKLEKNASADRNWEVYPFAIGNFDGNSPMNISKNSASSSLLDFEEDNASVNAAPESAFISSEQIEVKRLDSFLNEKGFYEPLFLKIDAQGFEERILYSAGENWPQIYALQLELACVPVYKGEKVFDEMKKYIESKGFFLSAIESNFADFETGRLLQVETIFLRKL